MLTDPITQSVISTIRKLPDDQFLGLVRTHLNNEGGQTAAPTATGNGRWPGRAAKTGANRSSARGRVASKPARRGAVGAKRSPEELNAVTEQIHKHIATHPGQGAEDIGKALGLTTPQINRPMKRLLASKVVRAEGQKRATKYYPAGWTKRAGGSRGKKNQAAAPVATG